MKGFGRSPRVLYRLLAWSLLLMLAWGLWLWRLGASDLTFDEAGTYFVANRPILAMLSYLRGASREHPPLYFLLTNIWIHLVGPSEFGLRSLSVCTGLLVLAMFRWLGQSLWRTPVGTQQGGEWGNILAAVLIVATPGAAYYAREARMYALGMLWAVLSGGIFLRSWLSTRGWPCQTAWVALAAVNLAAGFTHYYLLLLLITQPLVLLLARRWRPLLAWCALHGFLGVFGIVWFISAPGLRKTVESLGWGTIALPSVSWVLWLIGKLIFSPVVRIRSGHLWVLIAYTIVGLGSVCWRLRERGIWLLGSVLFPAVLILLLPHTPAPRFLVFILPYVAFAQVGAVLLPLALLDISLWRARRSVRWVLHWVARGMVLVSAIVLGGVLVTGGLVRSLVFEKSRYGRTLELVQAYALPGDGVLFYGPWQWIQYEYYKPSDFPPITTLPPTAPPHLNPEEAKPVLASLLEQYSRLWVLPAAVDNVDPARFVAGWLNTHAHCVWETPDFSLYLPPLPEESVLREDGSWVFGGTIALEEVVHERPPVPAGEPLRLILYWRPRVSLGRDIRIEISLVDQDGHIWVQRHALPGQYAVPPSKWEAGELYADYEGLIVPPGAPPGDYVVRLLVVDARTDDPLLTNEGAVAAGISSVTVVPPVRPPILFDLPNRMEVSFCAPNIGGSKCLSLVGYEPGGLRFTQGYPLPVVLHWLVRCPWSEPVQLRLELVSQPWQPWRHSAVLSAVTESLVMGDTLSGIGDSSASSLCPQGSENTVPSERVLTVMTALMVPVDAPAGRAIVNLGVQGEDGLPWNTASGNQWLSLFPVTIQERPVLRRLPLGVRRVSVDFGEEVGLRGYRLEGEARPGEQLRVTYFWYARRQPTAIYAVFTHVVAADGSLVAQVDSWPQGGRMLTTQWRAGEYVEDSYTLAIPADAPPGPYMLRVGLYDAATQERQPAFGAEGRLTDDQLVLRVPDGGVP